MSGSGASGAVALSGGVDGVSRPLSGPRTDRLFVDVVSTLRTLLLSSGSAALSHECVPHATRLAPLLMRARTSDGGDALAASACAAASDGGCGAVTRWDLALVRIVCGDVCGPAAARLPTSVRAAVGASVNAKSRAQLRDCVSRALQLSCNALDLVSSLVCHCDAALITVALPACVSDVLTLTAPACCCDRRVSQADARDGYHRTLEALCVDHDAAAEVSWGGRGALPTLCSPRSADAAATGVQRLCQRYLCARPGTVDVTLSSMVDVLVQHCRWRRCRALWQRWLLTGVCGCGGGGDASLTLCALCLAEGAVDDASQSTAGRSATPPPSLSSASAVAMSDVDAADVDAVHTIVSPLTGGAAVAAPEAARRLEALLAALAMRGLWSHPRDAATALPCDATDEATSTDHAAQRRGIDDDVDGPRDVGAALASTHNDVHAGVGAAASNNVIADHDVVAHLRECVHVCTSVTASDAAASGDVAVAWNRCLPLLQQMPYSALPVAAADATLLALRGACVAQTSACAAAAARLATSAGSGVAGIAGITAAAAVGATTSVESSRAAHGAVLCAVTMAACCAKAWAALWLPGAAADGSSSIKASHDSALEPHLVESQFWRLVVATVATATVAVEAAAQARVDVDVADIGVVPTDSSPLFPVTAEPLVQDDVVSWRRVMESLHTVLQVRVLVGLWRLAPNVMHRCLVIAVSQPFTIVTACITCCTLHAVITCMMCVGPGSAREQP